jgi:hypothetical protein
MRSERVQITVNPRRPRSHVWQPRARGVLRAADRRAMLDAARRIDESFRIALEAA